MTMPRPQGKSLKIAKKAVPGLPSWATKKTQSTTRVRPDVDTLQAEGVYRFRYGYKKGRDK